MARTTEMHTATIIYTNGAALLIQCGNANGCTFRIWQRISQMHMLLFVLFCITIDDKMLSEHLTLFAHCQLCRSYCNSPFGCCLDVTQTINNGSLGLDVRFESEAYKRQSGMEKPYKTRKKKLHTNFRSFSSLSYSLRLIIASVESD